MLAKPDMLLLFVSLASQGCYGFQSAFVAPIGLRFGANTVPGPMGTNLIKNRGRIIQFETDGNDDVPVTPMDEDGVASNDTSVDTTTTATSQSAKTTPITKKKASKRQMLKFAGPALGIYLANPLLSNIDNAFVGRTVGTTGLAALSPGTILTDQMIYLFNSLPRATTGLVSKAYGAKGGDTSTGDIDAAREAASVPLTVSLFCGIFLTVMYTFFTPNLMSAFNVNPKLRADAASYIYWRSTAAWAALAQGCCLSIMLSTRDAVTPLKIVAIAALFNIMGDAALCMWPLRWGCAGAAAATAGATLFSSAVMVKALRDKNLLPQIRLPKFQQLKELLEYALPLFAITITRISGFIAMQKSAMALGVQPLAAYQLCLNMMMFFLLFGEPLSQLSQTQLPALMAAQDGEAVRATLKSATLLALYTSLAVGGIAYAMVTWGSAIFTADAGVRLLAKQTAPAIFAAVSTSIFTVAVDGSMLASKDFGFMLAFGMSTFMVQLFLLRNYCTSIAFVFGTFTFRLGSYALLALARTWLGFGPLGRAIPHPRMAVHQ